ncbi:hypothetical protein [Synechococcus sp. RS9916]|uniref:hypothetical protein n=1 Tax=Synechococcus sp. RS9916 TaxID=221359 RepID=UPI0012EABC70|nr:hypothetical protein [Synechococcus sp. RS9916]
MSEACCQSCQHCTASTSGASGPLVGWCRLRRLPVHAELARVAWCHHWTPRAPALPELQGSDQPLPPSGRQLELTPRD